jgi:two-component system cell cycle sensor histidine kinase/response regulator CckA
MTAKPASEGLKQRVKDSDKQTVDRKRAEEALTESEERYRILFEGSRDAIYITTPQGTFIDANQPTFDLLGYSREEMEALNARHLYVNVMNGARFQKEIEERGFVRDYEVKLRKRDGTQIDCLFNVSVRRANDGTILAYQGIIRDITERKRAEEALRESEEKYRDLVERANDGIAIACDEVLQYVNPRLAQILGYTVEELTGSPFARYFIPEEVQKVVDLYNRRMAGENVIPIYETVLRHKDGSAIDVELNTGIIAYKDKRADLVIIRDITERKRAEKEKRKLETQFHQAQKMEALGTLAGGIAHDFNNLLMGIQGNASLVLCDIDSDHLHYENLRTIEELVQSGAQLTRQLLGFSRRGKYQVKPTDINELIRNNLEMFARTKKEITIHTKYQEGIWPVEVDRGQIEQVLLNLFVNAWQAMPGKGELYLETENVTLTETYIKPHQVNPGGYVKISVADTGVGIDKKTQQRIFDPFFTTKEMGRGTGLGLASSYGIVKNHDGIINVYSEKGKGTTFTIYLPISEKEVRQEKALSEEILKGSETVLLVDDEDFILSVGSRVLKKLGYEVLTASSGEAAIDVYKANKDKIDMVILDMIMPEMGGGDTYDRIKEINPAVKALLSSGYSIDGQATEILQRGCHDFIQKPFDMKGLSQKIREILDKE